MTAFRRIAVLDIGKTNAKVVVVDCDTGKEVCERRQANRVLSGPPYPHFDIEGLWTFMARALAEFASEPGYDAISVTTHGAAAALVDAQGALALPVLDYEHRYPAGIEQAYSGLRPPFAETFSPALAGGLNLGAQLHYQKTAFPAAFARTHAILTYPQYWAFQLTGVAANEVTSLGCHTDLWRPRECGYSTLVDTLDIRHLMAPVRSAFETLGPTTHQVTAAFGLAGPVPVFCGIHDSNASLLPHLVAHEPPFAVVSTGTWVISFAVGGHLDGIDPDRDCLANVDAYGRAVPSSRFMGGREFQQMQEEFGEFDVEAATAAIPSVIERRTMLLPNLAEGSGPFPRRKSRWIHGEGMSGDERWAAACLYLSLMTKTCLDLVGAGGSVLVEGPFSRNRLYLAALQALLGRDVLAMPDSTGTSQGAALLAGAPAKARVRTVSSAAFPDLSVYAAAWNALLD